MAMIIRATPNEGAIPTGFPILVNEAMQIIEPAFAYLLDVATIPGRSRSPRTVRAYSEHLLDWFDTLEQMDISWKEVTRAILAAYRNRHLEQVSPRTKRPYATSTINARVGAVCRFYMWAQQEGLVDHVPFNKVEVRRWQRDQPFSLPRVMANEMTMRVYEKQRRALSDDEIRRLKDKLKQPYKLMADWALATGMRRMEICALKLGDVLPHIRQRGPGYKLVAIPLKITKGDRPRDAYAPLRLLDYTERYINEVREPLIRARRRRHPSYRSEDALFLGIRGQPIKPNRMSDAFRRAFRAEQIGADFHCLRHTYAIRSLHALTKAQKDGKDINVLMYLRHLMGHASIATTERYLRSLELRPEEIPEGLGYLYGDEIDVEHVN